MPSYKFTGSQPTFINGLCDVNGTQVGYLQPGEDYELPEVSVGSPFVLADESAPGGATSSADASVPSPVPETPEPAPVPVPETPENVAFSNPAQVIVH